MEKSKPTIAIIGGGVSGLIAAINLEKHGFESTIYEASDRVGGRLKTDVVEEYRLDHGFQVILTAYPMVKQYIKLDELDLIRFLPGAELYSSKPTLFGDPLRENKFLLPTLLSKAATVQDKLKIFRLTKHLKAKSFEEIFLEKEQTTIDYLKGKGFSEKVIDLFFKPFYGGIFLEEELHTSSRMFEFTFKCFAEGEAILPINGIEEIPKQLAAQLKKTTIECNSSIEELAFGKLKRKGDQDSIVFDYAIIATEAEKLIPNLRNQEIPWKSCECLYFNVEGVSKTQALIGLVPSNKGALMNNIFHYEYNNGPKAKTLLSVTIIKEHDLSEERLVEQIKNELKEQCGIEVAQFIRRYVIPKALPKLSDIRYELDPSETRLTDTVFLAGDHQLNASLNAAMLSGEKAALALMERIHKA